MVNLPEEISIANLFKGHRRKGKRVRLSSRAEERRKKLRQIQKASRKKNR